MMLEGMLALSPSLTRSIEYTSTLLPDRPGTDRVGCRLRRSGQITPEHAAWR
jgi:hypothetical protein